VQRESGFVGQLVADGYGSSVAKVGDKGAQTPPPSHFSPLWTHATAHSLTDCLCEWNAFDFRLAGFYNTDTYRTILSFDTSFLVPEMSVSQAVLRIYRRSLTGAVGQISIDVKQGYFGNSDSLEQVPRLATTSPPLPLLDTT
jgi:hypothetical protein